MRYHVVYLGGFAVYEIHRPEDYEEFKAFKHRKYVADALRAVEAKKDHPDYWMSEDEFFAGLEE
jgi:hypothetical protein